MRRGVAVAEDPSPGAALIRRYGLLCAWMLLVWGMVQSWEADPYNPALTGTEAYGHNRKAGILWGPAFTALELALVYLGLQLWSGSSTWWRPVGGLLVLALFAPLTFGGVLALMHAGGIAALHVLWLVLLDLVLILTVVLALIDRYLRHRHRLEQAA